MNNQSVSQLAVWFAAEARTSCSALSATEMETMVLVGKGMTGKEVAKMMGLCVSAIDERRTRALAKLGVTSSIEAAVILTKAGML